MGRSWKSAVKNIKKQKKKKIHIEDNKISEVAVFFGTGPLLKIWKKKKKCNAAQLERNQTQLAFLIPS